MKRTNSVENWTQRLLSGRAKLAFAIAVASVAASFQCQGQGTFQPITVTFDGPPVQPPGTAAIVQQYYESGVWFISNPSVPGAGFIRVGSSPVPGRPDNGTAYLQAAVGTTVRISVTNLLTFSLLGVDLAEHSTGLPDAVTVHFVGYRSDGSVITTDLTTDGVIDGSGLLADFQTFQFGPEWYGLTRVEIPTYRWSLDNLVVSVPEPASGALLLAGGLLLCLLHRRR